MAIILGSSKEMKIVQSKEGHMIGLLRTGEHREKCGILREIGLGMSYYQCLSVRW